MGEVRINSTYNIHEVLPEEIFVMILKKLDYNSLTISRDTCTKWRAVIDGFELLSMKNFCKFYMFHNLLLEHINQQKSLSFPVKRPCVIIAGGYSNGGRIDFVEVLSGLSKIKIQLPNIPYKVNHCSMFLHDGSLMFCVGYDQSHDTDNAKRCFKLDQGKWIRHSTLNNPRVGSKAVSTDKGTFLFGGSSSQNTYEFLPNDAQEWRIGINQIPGGFVSGCAIEVKSKQQIWVIGGNGFFNRILAFDINSETFHELPSKLNRTRISFACSFIPGTNKILVSGGSSRGFNSHKIYDESTEIIDIEHGNVTMGGSLNIGRVDHGMGTININGEERLAVFGGVDGTRNKTSSVELYNAKTDQWEMADFTLNEPKFSFGYVTVKK